MADKSKTPVTTYGYGLRREKMGWRALQYKITDGRLVSTHFLCEFCDYGSAAAYLRKGILSHPWHEESTT